MRGESRLLWAVFSKSTSGTAHIKWLSLLGFKDTGLRIGNTLVFIIVLAKVKTLHRIFPSLSLDFSLGAFKVGQSALNEGSELLLGTFGSVVHSDFSFFWKSLAVQKQNRKEFFPGAVHDLHRF